MFDSFRFPSLKAKVFSSITFAIIILFIVFADSIISNFSLNSDQLRTHKTGPELRIKSADNDQSLKITTDDRIVQPEIKLKPENSQLFASYDPNRKFDSRVRQFFSRNQCKVQIFMTWIAPADSFGERELFGLGSLFQTNPESCLIILSQTLDSDPGRKILNPLIERGFRVRAISPDLYDLLKNTPAESWFHGIKSGITDPGQIPLAQNLSNLIRLAVLYKYGGVYLDTDFIILKDFSGLRNSIGAQSVGISGNWTRLNNAVLVFDKNHPLVYKFLEQFALTFDGSRWGHNGPYLVSRVVSKLDEARDYDFTILPPAAFYPVDWTRVSGFFSRVKDRAGEKWVEAKIRQLNGSSYGVHLWNKHSSKLKIEEGSILGRLISDHCVVCSSNRYISTSG